MAERVAFLLGKDPATSHGGDMTMFRAMRAIVAERYDTEVICLSEQPHDAEPDVVRIAKPPISKPLLLARSLVPLRADRPGATDRSPWKTQGISRVRRRTRARSLGAVKCRSDLSRRRVPSEKGAGRVRGTRGPSVMNRRPAVTREWR